MPLFTECETGITYPMAPEGNLRVLGDAHGEVAANAANAGDPLLVSFTGRLESRPGSDGQSHDAVVVVDFGAILINEICAATDAVPPLERTDWRAVRIMGSPVPQDDPPTLALDPQNGVVGWSGCRPVTGVYTLQGGQLRFGALERPDLPCEGSIRWEQLYLSALQGTGSYEMSRDTLRLVGESGTLAVFVGR